MHTPKEENSQAGRGFSLVEKKKHIHEQVTHHRAYVCTDIRACIRTKLKKKRTHGKKKKGRANNNNNNQQQQQQQQQTTTTTKARIKCYFTQEHDSSKSCRMVRKTSDHSDSTLAAGCILPPMSLTSIESSSVHNAGLSVMLERKICRSKKR